MHRNGEGAANLLELCWRLVLETGVHIVLDDVHAPIVLHLGAGLEGAGRKFHLDSLRVILDRQEAGVSIFSY